MAAPTPSGVRHHLKVDLTDGRSLDIQTIPFDAVRWERKAGKAYSESGGMAEMLVFLAYTAAHRLKLTSEAKFDDFAGQVAEIYVIEDDEDTDQDPTPADTQTEELPS